MLCVINVYSDYEIQHGPIKKDKISITQENNFEYEKVSYLIMNA
jgi:hypothetical protein